MKEGEALTEEVYLKSQKQRKPSIVESSAKTVKILGTHFNVNSYGDNNVLTTTLLEGSVEITKGG